MLTDRELLEAAAKAIGLTLLYNHLGMRDARQPWDPLTDDGDALRLAVKLGISIEFVSGLLVIARPSALHEDCRDHAGDMGAATRRAIVRAAVELGKVA